MRMRQDRRAPRLPVSWRAIVLVQPESETAANVVRQKSGLGPQDANLSLAVTAVPVMATAVEISRFGISLKIDHLLGRGETHEVVLAMSLAGMLKKIYVQGHLKVVHGYLTKEGKYRIGAEFSTSNAAAASALLVFLKEETNRLENLWCKATGEYEYIKHLYDKD